MVYNPNIHHRRSIRLKNYDYSQNGAYFITICTHKRECLLCEIINGEIILSEIGVIAKNNWLEIPQHFPNVQLDEFVIMPNHIHGILILNNEWNKNKGVQNNKNEKTNVGVQYIEPQPPQPQRKKFQHIIPKSIGSIIRSFKSSVANIYRINGFTNFRWQRNYYEHIIRNDIELNKIREYIINNPLSWENDENNLGD